MVGGLGLVGDLQKIGGAAVSGIDPSGLGGQLLQQQRDETEDQRRKRLQQLRDRALSGGLGAQVDLMAPGY